MRRSDCRLRFRTPRGRARAVYRAARGAIRTSGGQKATASKDLFNVTERLIDGLLADIKPKLATLDGSSPEYGRKTSTAFFLAKAFKTYRAINLLVECQ